jgi:hypothetical protein
MIDWMGLFLLTVLWITATVVGLTVLRWALGLPRARAGALAGTLPKGTRKS